MDRGLRANIKIKISHLNHSMNVPYLHFWHLKYGNSEPVLVALFVWRLVRGRWRSGELEYNLVFEASVEVFVREDDRVENYHLGRDVDVATWGNKKKPHGCVLAGDVLYISITLICRLPPRPFTNQYILIKTRKMNERLALTYRGWWSRVWVFRLWRGSRCRFLRTGHWDSGHSGFPPLGPTFQWCCPNPRCCSKHRNDPGKTLAGQIKRE